MSKFDKFCAVLAVVLAVVLLLLGVIGLFAGCSANFTLPPVLGVLPTLIGWGIIRSVIVAFRASPPPYVDPPPNARGFEVMPPGSTSPGPHNPYNDGV